MFREVEQLPVMTTRFVPGGWVSLQKRVRQETSGTEVSLHHRRNNWKLHSRLAVRGGKVIDALQIVHDALVEIDMHEAAAEALAHIQPLTLASASSSMASDAGSAPAVLAAPERETTVTVEIWPDDSPPCVRDHAGGTGCEQQGGDNSAGKLGARNAASTIRMLNESVTLCCTKPAHPDHVWDHETRSLPSSVESFLSKCNVSNKAECHCCGSGRHVEQINCGLHPEGGSDCEPLRV